MTMVRRIFGLIGLMAACAAIFISASGAGADVAPAADPSVQSVQTDQPSNDYEYDEGGDDYATTTVPETTTTKAPTTTTAAPTTTVAPTTTAAVPTSVAPQVLNKVAEPAPKVAAATDELASTGAGSAVLAGIGAAAIALGLLARRTARNHS
jgi:NAD/NADP transhydrogenase alpha subunit